MNYLPDYCCFLYTCIRSSLLCSYFHQSPGEPISFRSDFRFYHFRSEKLTSEAIASTKMKTEAITELKKLGISKEKNRERWEKLGFEVSE